VASQTWDQCGEELRRGSEGGVVFVLKMGGGWNGKEEGKQTILGFGTYYCTQSDATTDNPNKSWPKKN